MKTIGSALLVLVLCSIALTQEYKEPHRQIEETHVEGFLTKSGVVNLVEGQVALLRPDAPPQVVQPKLEVQNGDAILTAQDGRIEVLLNPGYYLRLFGNTRIVFLDLAPDNLTLTITKGSAIIEIAMIKPRWTSSWEPDPKYSAFYDPITVNFPQNETSLVAGGIYRFDVSAGGETHMKVPQGRAFFAGRRIENGMRATFISGSATFAKFDTDEADDFDRWSQARGHALVRSNQTLKNAAWYQALQKNRRSYIKIAHDGPDSRSREVHTVRALGGVTTFVQPGVFFRDQTSEWKPLNPETQLEFGEQLKTDANGRAQIALYGTCWLFLGSNTEVVYGVRPDGDSAIKVLRGSAIVVLAYGDEDQDQRPIITLAAPQVEYEILRDGTYQLTANNNTAEMNIYSGRVRVAGREINHDKRIVFRNSNLDIQRVSKRERDALYVWSLKRLSALTRDLRLKLIGVWYFDNANKTYTLVTGWYKFRSPYGGDYNVGLRYR